MCVCFVLLIFPTGKTGVFSIGILQRLDTASNETQALVLSPTRELAEQTQKVGHIIRWIRGVANGVLTI